MGFNSVMQKDKEIYTYSKNILNDYFRIKIQFHCFTVPQELQTYLRYNT